MNTRKKAHLNLESRRTNFLVMGLLFSTAVTLAAFNWTTYNEVDYALAGADIEETIITEVPPVTVQKPKVIQRPKVTVVDFSKAPELVKNEVVLDSVIKPQVMDTTDLNLAFIDECEECDTVDSGGWTEPTIFVSVENMPAWNGCAEKTEPKRKEFTDKNIFKFLGENLKYPRIAVDGGIEGVVYVEYIVDYEGNIANASVLRGVHPALDKEALRVVNSFPQFQPGKQRTVPVNVKYTLPIRFTLN